MLDMDIAVPADMQGMLGTMLTTGINNVSSAFN